MSDEYSTKDKFIAPYLLTQPDIQLVETRIMGAVVYFVFSPSNVCIERVNKFLTRKADPIQPKDIFEAIETFKNTVYVMKERMNYDQINR